MTTSGKASILFNITDPQKPFLESALQLDGVDYGDFTSAVWGVAWQGKYIYVGGTNTGLSIIDASNPRDPKVVNRVATGRFGGINAGPLFAIGNLLVVTTPKRTPASPRWTSQTRPTRRS